MGEVPEPGACPPCRGTGTIVSSLGGESQSITCPWCGGTGRRPAPTEATES